MLDQASRLKTVHHWHRYVQYHEIRSVLSDLPNSVGSVCSLANDFNVGVRLKYLANATPNGLAIVHHEHANYGRLHAAS